jgi:hypothetical protein
MTGILTSISNLLQSILDVFTSLFNTLFSSIQGVFALAATAVQSVLGLFQGLIGFLLSMYSSCATDRKGVLTWVVDNIVIIGVIIAGFVGYSAYQQRQHKTVTGKKQI